MFTGRMKNGETFDYSHVDPGEDMQKLLDVIQAVKTGEPPVCGIRADLPHIEAVRMVQACPIRPVDSRLVEQVLTENDRFFFVKDLEQNLARCADQWALPGELGIRLD